VREHLRRLTTGTAIYGAGDAAITVVNFLLLPLYVRILSPEDYGALLVLISIETFAKLINRWGLDGAFMRFYLERQPGAARQDLASSILVFLMCVDGAILAVLLIASRDLVNVLFGHAQYLSAMRLMLVNTCLVAFTFVPFHVMRLEDRAVSHSSLTVARSAGTTVLRLILVAGVGLGVTGLYLADLAVTVALLPALWRWTRPLVAPRFSWTELRASLRFGLPRLPHGLAQQAFDYGNRLLLVGYVPLAEAGVYQNGATLGSAVKFFLAAFETAWAPFYYATARQADGRLVLAKVTTYGLAIIAVIVAGTSAIAADLVALMLGPVYADAVPVVRLVALALGCQGIFLLTSIGLNLSGRTAYYPAATFAAALVGLSTGMLAIPRLGSIGAAIALVAAFGTQAAAALTFSRRAFPIAYETGRIVRVAVAAAAAVVLPIAISADVPAWIGLVARGSASVLAFAAVLGITGFFRETERRFVAELLRRSRTGRGAAHEA
jgi:O-antigen/teichoic acid export membrane protein